MKELKDYLVSGVNREDLSSINNKLRAVSKKCSEPFNSILEKLDLGGFFYGSISRGDNVTPDADKILKQGGNPLDYFWGNDLDVVLFGMLDVKDLVDYFCDNGLNNKLRLHVYYYKMNDVERLAGFINEHLEGLPGSLKLFPSGRSAGKRLQRIAKKLKRPVKDVQVINDRSVRDELKRNYDYNYPLGLACDRVTKIGFSRQHPFLTGSNLRRVELGLLITQFISTTNANNCEDIIKKIKSSIDSVSVADIMLTNTRTVYDKQVINKELFYPRYFYDGFLKLFRNIYISKFGTNRCCKSMNAIDFYEVLKGDLYEKELPVDDIRDALGMAASIKVLSRNPVNKGLVIKAGKRLFDEYLRLCDLIDKSFFPENPGQY
ncbi:hypothetical protein GF352_00375 [archaeon]|nr:hypothetical protein [archaeon]